MQAHLSLTGLYKFEKDTFVNYIYLGYTVLKMRKHQIIEVCWE